MAAWFHGMPNFPMAAGIVAMKFSLQPGQIVCETVQPSETSLAVLALLSGHQAQTTAMVAEQVSFMWVTVNLSAINRTTVLANPISVLLPHAV